MSTVEQEIVEKFHQLEPDAKQRVLDTLFVDLRSSFDYADWWAKVDALQASIQAHLGDQDTVGALSLLDELRREPST